MQVSDTALACLSLMARHHGIDLPVEKMVHDYAIQDSDINFPLLSKIAHESSLKTRALNINWLGFFRLGKAYPLIARLTNGNCVVVINCIKSPDGGGDKVAVLDPLVNRPGLIMITEHDFCRVWSGDVMLIKRKYKLTAEDQPFGLRWFLAEVLRHKPNFRDVAIAAVMLHILGMGLPIFTQIVIDKVLSHQNYSTLYVVSGCAIVVVLFEATFTFLRGIILLHATTKIDARLASRTFGHMVSLPLPFFEQMSAGILVKHMQQTEKIRQFLTGKVFTTLLDSFALPVFLPVLLLYSPVLTGIVVLFSGVIALIIFSIMGLFRRRLQECYSAEAARQALLVETIHGMRTVKAMALEPVQLRKWEDIVATAIRRYFGVGRISTSVNAIISLIERLMMISVIITGTYLVFGNLLSIGTMVAFQMLSGRVTGPLVAMATLVHEYQEASLSLSMLGNVMNARSEHNLGGGMRPEVRGHIQFCNVSFRYPGSMVPALNRVAFDIPEGSVVGVVGRSGSGKTTITRLIQGIHAAQDGLIKIDGNDIRDIDLAHLRRSIGVVLQENFLFRGTIKDNIRLMRSDATLSDVARVVKLAGADEFIEQLPQGFDTMIEENGTNFSGGQRQRLAIARALMNNPRLLIFDEATSALDPDSEAIVQANLDAIAKGRTVVVISHRLSSLVASDAILVLEKGNLVNIGKHRDLLQIAGPYRHLWQQQTRHIG